MTRTLTRHPQPPVPGPLDVGGQGRRVVELLDLGLLTEADEAIAAHARLAAGHASLGDRLDAAAWAAMRALLAGRRDDALAAHEVVRSLATDGGGAEAEDRCWLQRFWIAFHWGDERERYDVLDHCRERAYRFGDPAWGGMLALLVADMGKLDEAARAFDATLPQLDALAHDALWLDAATNLAETAWLVGDPVRARLLHGRLAGCRMPFVTAARGWAWKGPLDRFLAFGAAAAGRWVEADDGFRTAVTTTRQAGAQALLARSLEQWGHSLRGRDDVRAGDCLSEGAELTRKLGLTLPGAPTGKVA